LTLAEIKAFRAWRYTDQAAASIGELTSPLFDVVSGRQREKLYRHPLNSIHISVPASIGQAAQTLAQWKLQKAIVQDDRPAIYVYYQYFYIGSQAFCRKGFISFIRAYDWAEGVVMRHENTIPGAVSDRTELLRATLLNVSPTHGLYTDPDLRLEAYMDAAMQQPLLETEDYQGVRDVLACITDPDIIGQFVAIMADKKVILADGHHRYEGSLAYRHEQTAANLHHHGQEAYNFHLMYLTNTANEGLRILPTHRLLTNFPHFDEHEFLLRLREDFVITEVEPENLDEIISGKKWTFGLLVGADAYRIRLKPEKFADMYWHFPETVKQLDLTVLHYFVFEKLLGIKREQQRSSTYIRYERNFAECMAEVTDNRAQAAFITNPLGISDVVRVCESGAVMPQKSTYFYPKVVCGLVFGSIAEEEQ
jgi:uncharacterized protein (DUF1015 family)